MPALATELVGHAGGWGGGWWPIFPLFWIILWGLLIFAIFKWRRDSHRDGRSAEDVLAERYARGEITVEEYRERLGVLKER